MLPTVQGLTVQILGRHVRPSVDQELAHLEVSSRRRTMQWSPAVLVAGIDALLDVGLA
jgi:hypothetical protein